MPPETIFSIPFAAVITVFTAFLYTVGRAVSINVQSQLKLPKGMVLGRPDFAEAVFNGVRALYVQPAKRLPKLLPSRLRGGLRKVLQKVLPRKLLLSHTHLNWAMFVLVVFVAWWLYRELLPAEMRHENYQWLKAHCWEILFFAAAFLIWSIRQAAWCQGSDDSEQVWKQAPNVCVELVNTGHQDSSIDARLMGYFEGFLILLTNDPGVKEDSSKPGKGHKADPKYRMIPEDDIRCLSWR